MEFIRENFVLIFLVMTVVLFSIVGFVMRRRYPIIGEFFAFMMERKLWWMAPIFIFLLLISFLIIAAGYAPFIYTLF